MDPSMSQTIPVAMGNFQQPGVYLLQVMPISGHHDWNKVFPRRMVKSLAVGQVALSFVAFVAEVVLITTVGRELSAGPFAGIWTGIFFGIAGGLGIVSAAKPGRCSIIGFLVMSIIAALMTIPLLGLSLTGLTYIQECLREGESDKPYWCTSNAFTGAVFDAILCFTAVCEIVIAVICSALCCRAVCCSRTKYSSATATYIAQPANPSSGPIVPSDAFPLQSQAASIGIPSAASASAREPPPAYQEKETTSSS